MLYTLVTISTFLMTVLAFGLGVFSLSKDHKSKISITWFLTSMAVTAWGAGYLYVHSFVKNDAEAFRGFYLVYLGASLIPVFSFHFISSFLYNLDKQYKYLLYLGYILGPLFFGLILTTHFIIKGVRYMENLGHYEEITTVGFKIFLVYFLSFAFMNIYLLIRGYLKSDGSRRRKILYVLIASLFGFLGGISNFVTDLTGIYPYGQMVVWLYPVLITYGIFLK